MRILKKSLALILAIAMMASLIVVNVAAEGEELKAYVTVSKDSVKTNGEFTVNAYITKADGTDAKVGMITIEIGVDDTCFSVTNEDVTTPITDATAGYNATKKIVSINRTASSEITTSSTAPVFSAKLKAIKTVDADEEKTFSIGTVSIRKPGAPTAYTVDSTGTDAITIKPSFTATVATLESAVDAVDAGTAKADIITTLNAKTATVANGADPLADGYKSAAGYATTAWDCTEYNAAVPGSYTFTGNVVADDNKSGGWEGVLPVTASVTVEALTTATITVETDATKLEVKKGTAVADVVALVKEAITKITFSGNGLTAEIAKDAAGLTYTQSAEITGEEDVAATVTVTLTFADVDGGVIFEDIDGEETIDVTIVPAEIAGGKITVKGQRATDIPEVTAVIPADKVTGPTCDVKIIFYELTAEKALGAAKETITANVPVTAGQETIITRSASQNLKEMEFDEVGEEFAVQVLVNNAALKDGAKTFNTYKVVASTGGSVGGIGNSIVPAKPQTPVEKPEEPGTEEPGTEEPGTEEPGTEEPGTEEPGTEEPGTEEPATGFEDVTAEFDWAAESINKLADLGVINGKGDNKFAPNDDITRAEFTKMIVTLLGLEATGTETAFADCAADDWFTPYIIAATEAGVINGVADDAFAPNDTITREQACTILGRALALADEAEVAFTDAAEISDYAAEFVAALAELGIINGYEDGSFAPANNITRAEAAKILAGALDIIAPVEEAPAEEVVEEVVAE